MTTIPPDPAVRRAQILALATDYALAGDHGDLDKVAAEAERIGVDLTDPLTMAAVSVLADCQKYGLEPSKRALFHLGVGDAA